MEALAKMAPARPRAGDWIQTFTGRQYWPLDPRPEDVSLYDIAHALSLLCRYGGHCREFYSVAEHSVLVSRVVPERFALQGLMHDATEAYCVDVPRPLKRFLPSYEHVEHVNWVAICQAYGMPVELDETVHAADNSVLVAEMRVLMRQTGHDWSLQGVEPADVRIRCLQPSEAEWEFIARFKELTQ